MLLELALIEDKEEEAVVVEAGGAAVVLETRIGGDGDDGMTMTEFGRVVDGGERIRSRDRICPVLALFDNAEPPGK